MNEADAALDREKAAISRFLAPFVRLSFSLRISLSFSLFASTRSLPLSLNFAVAFVPSRDPRSLVGSAAGKPDSRRISRVAPHARATQTKGTMKQYQDYQDIIKRCQSVSMAIRITPDAPMLAMRRSRPSSAACRMLSGGAGVPSI